ncbi:MAG: hypothetical protein SFV23_11960 [Planctomycetaceae bacterium]|nr:hypothetical protein [Planctomycetaceae bacterium]
MVTIPLVLDSSALGKLCHPKQPKNRSFVEAVTELSGSATPYADNCAPAIAEYELRRKFLRLVGRNQASLVSVERLDDLCSELWLLARSRHVLRLAAGYWSELRRRGLPTDASASPDADVILAAQAATIGGWVVTSTFRHLIRLIPVIRSEDIGRPHARRVPARSDNVPPAEFEQTVRNTIGPVWIHPNQLPFSGLQ